MKILYEEFEKLPFVDTIPDNKGFIGGSFFDEKKGYLQDIIVNENNKFMILKSNGLIKGYYWSKKNIDPKKDIYINLLHLLSNKLSFDELTNVIMSIEQDVHNFGAIIHKRLFYGNMLKIGLIILFCKIYT
jgi:hypothetical protein